MPNTALTGAKKNKNDEFYTQLADIEREINAYLAFNPDVFRGKTVLLPCDDPKWSNFTRYFAQNFSRLGLKKLVSTGYAVVRKRELGLLPGFGPEEPVDERLTHGTIFTLDGDMNGNGVIDLDDLVGNPLEGDGDFRSVEVRRLRDEADVIVTNPPFSLFKEFLAWIMEAGKRFLVIGSTNAITYKDVFPHIMAGRVWLGNGFAHGDAYFGIPKGAREDYAHGVFNPETSLVKFRNCCWFTNLDHGRRHESLQLLTMEENRKYSRHAEVRKVGYPAYDNYDAIDVSFTDAIPGDYDGAMGVPISFLDKHCPAQFEILGASESEGRGFSNGLWREESGIAQPVVAGERKYKRLFIRKKKETAK